MRIEVGKSIVSGYYTARLYKRWFSLAAAAIGSGYTPQQAIENCKADYRIKQKQDEVMKTTNRVEHWDGR